MAPPTFFRFLPDVYKLGSEILTSEVISLKNSTDHSRKIDRKTHVISSLNRKNTPLDIKKNVYVNQGEEPR